MKLIRILKKGKTYKYFYTHFKDLIISDKEISKKEEGKIIKLENGMTPRSHYMAYSQKGYEIIK